MVAERAPCPHVLIASKDANLAVAEVRKLRDELRDGLSDAAKRLEKTQRQVNEALIKLDDIASTLRRLVPRKAKST